MKHSKKIAIEGGFGPSGKTSYVEGPPIYERGDFVVYKRRPEFRGVVLDVWEGPYGGPRATVVWENGMKMAQNIGLDLEPGGPFTTPKLRKKLRVDAEASRAAAAKALDRAKWIEKFLKVKSGKVRK